MNGTDQRGVITDIQIPFWRLVVFFVKAALAAIPAAIILWLIFVGIAIAFGSLFGVGWWMQRWTM